MIPTMTRSGRFPSLFGISVVISVRNNHRNLLLVIYSSWTHVQICMLNDIHGTAAWTGTANCLDGLKQYL